MRRFIIWIFATLIAALTGGFAIAGHAPNAWLAPVSASELATVTGGICFVNCDDEEEEEEEEEEDEPRLVSTDWRTVRQTDGPAEQLSYSIFTELSNAYGDRPMDYEVAVNDQCRFRWVSGGVGIATGFNIQVGRTYGCAVSSVLRGEIKAGYRLKVYKGDMRQYSTITVAEYLLYSDGSSRESGARDVGRREHRWSRFTPVQIYGR